MPRHGLAAGQRFGKLVAIETVGVDHNQHRVWRFKCDCGNVIVARGASVRYGAPASCGCACNSYGKSSPGAPAAERNGRYKHGLSGTREYFIWADMQRRCFDNRNRSYALYGGRGIVVCEKWRNDFIAFYSDMGPRPSRNHSIKLIDRSGNYEPGNCCWAARSRAVPDSPSAP